jgi:hypothetical protein
LKKDNSQLNERENDKDVIFGRNSVAEAIKSGRPLDSVMVARGDRSGSIPKIVADAKKAGIVIKEVDSKKLDFICGHNNHQGIAALGAVKEYSTIEDIFNTATERNEQPFIIICDEISGRDEADKIILQKNSGIIFIASYHCDTPNQALKKSFIKKMFDEGVFSHICRLSRCGNDICQELVCYQHD